MLDKKTEELFVKLLIDHYKMGAFLDKLSESGLELDVDLSDNIQYICDYLGLDEGGSETIQIDWWDFSDKLKLKGFTVDNMRKLTASQSCGGFSHEESEEFYNLLKIEMKVFVDLCIEYKIVGLN